MEYNWYSELLCISRKTFEFEKQNRKQGNTMRSEHREVNGCVLLYVEQNSIYILASIEKRIFFSFCFYFLWISSRFSLPFDAAKMKFCGFSFSALFWVYPNRPNIELWWSIVIKKCPFWITRCDYDTRVYTSQNPTLTAIQFESILFAFWKTPIPIGHHHSILLCIKRT